MIFYNSPNPAPNPRRVRIFAAEKGITLETRDLSIPAREHKAEDFLALNPRGQTPALQLDDGTVIAESVAICRYLEVMHPQPPLFGTTATEQALIEMWNRRVEMILMPPVGAVWVHTHKFTAALPGRNAEWGEANRPRVFDALQFRWRFGRPRVSVRGGLLRGRYPAALHRRFRGLCRHGCACGPDPPASLARPRLGSPQRRRLKD